MAVLRAVGLLMGDGETGMGNGDRGAEWAAAMEGMARESFGFAVRSILTIVSCDHWRQEESASNRMLKISGWLRTTGR